MSVIRGGIIWFGRLRIRTKVGGSNAWLRLGSFWLGNGSLRERGVKLRCRGSRVSMISMEERGTLWRFTGRRRCRRYRRCRWSSR